MASVAETLLVGVNPALHVGNNFIVLDVLNKNFLFFDDGNEFAAFRQSCQNQPANLKNRLENSAKIIFSITSDCNLACPYCYVKGGEKKEHLSIDSAAKAINFVSSTRVKDITIQFFGGEPTLDLEVIKKIINYVRQHSGKKGFHFELSTNGVMQKKALKFFLSLPSLTWIVSLDGSKRIHNQQRPLRNNGDCYTSTLHAIKEIISKKRKLKIRTTVTSLNVKQMPKIVELFADLGIKLIHFEPFSPMGRGKFVRWLPSETNYVSNFLKAVEVAEKKGINVTQFGIFDLFNPSKYACVSPHKYKIVVMPNNTDVLFCLGAQEEFGAAVKLFTVGRISGKKLYINKRKLESLPFKFSVDKIKKCKSCFIKYLCKGICPALNAARNGDWKKPDNFSCHIRKGIIKGLLVKKYTELAVG